MKGDEEALRIIVQLLANGAQPCIHPYVPPGSVVVVDNPPAILFHSRAECEEFRAGLVARLKGMLS